MASEKRSSTHGDEEERPAKRVRNPSMEFVDLMDAMLFNQKLMVKELKKVNWDWSSSAITNDKGAFCGMVKNVESLRMESPCKLLFEG